MEALYQYWGKAEPCPTGGGGFQYHLLSYHGLDVAAVGHMLLREDDFLRRRIADVFCLPEQAVLSLVPFLLALHDLGKFSEKFQGLIPDLFLTLRGRKTVQPDRICHDSLGFLLWNESLLKAMWESDSIRRERDKDNVSAFRRFSQIMEIWVGAVAGHHGEPPQNRERNGMPLTLAHHFRKEEIAVAILYLKELEALFLRVGSIRGYLDRFLSGEGKAEARRSSWLLAGFAVLCDWLGSGDKFPYVEKPMQLPDYWERYALKQAEEAVYASGILSARPSHQTGMSALFPGIAVPSPLQDYASSVTITSGRQLYLLEDTTGSGKTEAALTLAHRLMAEGHADGVFIALPTMATANAMYERLAKAYRRLFEDPDSASLVLSHSARHLSASFLSSIDGNTHRHRLITPPKEETGGAQCAAWLADSRKKAALAHVGVGTLDQALLGVLPSRHQALRLFGLSRKVLVVDEVHAYDPYMLRLLQGLLRFHSALGGSAILLSATLPISIRENLVKSYLGELGTESTHTKAMAYPLATLANTASEVVETSLATRSGMGQEVRIEFVHSHEEVLPVLARTAESGGCACWIRNTVADAIDGYRQLQEAGIREGLLLFHARFAMGDRLEREETVCRMFGKGSTAADRRGKILVATQVVEQSLDLDFDVMVSDLAPVDLLVQRAGRLHRHLRDEEGNPWIDGRGIGDARGPSIFYLLSPPFEEDPSSSWYSKVFPRAAKVYPNHGQIWRTAKLLRESGGWRMPRDARKLIEGVYGDVDAPETPEGLCRKENEALGAAMAQASFAHAAILRLEDGYPFPAHAGMNR
ncbi:MAG: CRISPR-associated helicase Cas3' [Candidatus Deferrimicrobium sp.]